MCANKVQQYMPSKFGKKIAYARLELHLGGFAHSGSPNNNGGLFREKAGAECPTIYTAGVLCEFPRFVHVAKMLGFLSGFFFFFLYIYLWEVILYKPQMPCSPALSFFCPQGSGQTFLCEVRGARRSDLRHIHTGRAVGDVLRSSKLLLLQNGI